MCGPNCSCPGCKLWRQKTEIEHLQQMLRDIHRFLMWPGKKWPSETAEFQRELIEAEPWWEETEDD